MYNSNYYSDGVLLQLRPVIPAIHTFTFGDDLVIGVFQGKNEPHPEIDIKIRVLLPGEHSRPFLLPHESWALDLIIKAQHFRDEIVSFLDDYIEFYDNCHPFNSQEERDAYELVTIPRIKERYANVNIPGSMPIEGIAVILEYLCLNEKRDENAHQFRLLLNWIKEGANGQRSFMSVLNLAARHQEY